MFYSQGFVIVIIRTTWETDLKMQSYFNFE